VLPANLTRIRHYICHYIRHYLLVFLASAVWAGGALADYQWVPRPDAMHWHRLMDADRRGDVTRVLYKTMPSLEQSQAPDASVNVYVAELHPDGRIDNRTIQSGTRRFSALLLQRGADAVFGIVTPEHGATSVTAETWSTADGSTLASFDSAELKAVSTSLHIFPTADGNFFYVRSSARSSRSKAPNTLTWKKITPRGDELAQGQWTSPNAFSTLSGAFEVPDGGLGLLVTYRLIAEEAALETDAEAVQTYDVAGRELLAKIASETRLLATDARGQRQWLSPAIARDMTWLGEVAIPQSLPPEEMLAQNREQMTLMARVALDNGGNRSILDEARYGMLVDVSADRELDPPRHGLWFIEIGDDGQLLREQRIEPAAEHLDAKFERFRATADGGLLVAGSRREGQHFLALTALDADGDIEWTSRLSMNNAKLEGIGGTKARPWVYGQNYNDAQNKNQLWAERVDPSTAQTSAAAVSAGGSTAAQPEQPAAPAQINLPEPAAGCDCSCDEYAAIQALTERMQAASQAEVVAMIADPGYQQLMQCMGSCAMRYASCR